MPQAKLENHILKSTDTIFRGDIDEKAKCRGKYKHLNLLERMITLTQAEKNQVIMWFCIFFDRKQPVKNTPYPPFRVVIF